MQNTTQPVRGRFAPSPSGRMHLGNIFCAIVCWLSARSAGGSLVLRIEDLDTLRCTKQNAAVLIVDDLQFITGKEATQEVFYASVLKPRLEKKLLTVLFSEKGYTELSAVMRDDLRNLIKLGFHEID